MFFFQITLIYRPYEKTTSNLQYQVALKSGIPDLFVLKLPYNDAQKEAGIFDLFAPESRYIPIFCNFGKNIFEYAILMPKNEVF